MKSHDWIFLMFTTIICCTTIITIAQAQQRGRVKFGVSMQKDDVDTNNSSPEIVSIANQARGSASHIRASSRFRAAIPSAKPLTIEENKESPRPVQRGSRGRANDRSSRKLTAEATEAIPLVRSRKRINQAATSSDQPIKIELPTSNIDRTNVIRRTKTRSEPASSTSPSPTTSESIRRRSDVPSDGPSIESVRKVRTFTSRSVTKQAAAEVVSSETPLIVATTGSNWRNVAIKRGASKVKSSERKSKALDEDQLEDENYPEHFKLLLRKQQPSPDLLPKNYPQLPLQEDQTNSKLNEVYEAPRIQGRLRRLEQTSQETSDEILQVSRAIPKVRRVELKREDTARAALKTRRIEPPRLEENIESSLRNEEPPKSRRSDAEKLRAQVKINKAAIKSRRKEPSNEVQREDIPKVPLKSNRRTESSTEDNETEVKPNEIEESTKASKTLFLPRRAEPYRPKPKTTTQRPTTTSKTIKKPEVLAARTKFKNRFNSRLQFPSLRTKTSSTSDEIVKYDNEVVHTSPAPQPVRPLQITKSRNLALDRPVVDARPKPKQHKFSSRYRGDAFSRYQQKPEPSKPIYTPTIPALTTEPIPAQLDQVTPHNLENHDLNKSGSNFEGIVYDGKAGVWNMVEPVAGGLTRSEISVDSGGEVQPLAQSSVTVSIFEALADILSKTPSTTTSTTTTTTTSTTTSTTELPDIIQVPEQKIDSISSTTVNTHDPITDVMDDENSTITNAITNNDRDGRLLNNVEINPSTTMFTPTTNPPSLDNSDSLETITVPQYTSSSDTTLLFRSETEQTTLEFTDFTTLSLPASPTQPTLTNTNLTNISTNLLELTTLASNPPTSLPMPFLADALTTPGSSLITTPLLISAISNFLDTSVQNASETMATTTTENTTKTTTTATLDTNSTPTDASTTLSPPITTTFSPPSTGSPPVTISFLDLFTIQAKKVNQNTEPAVEVHPIYNGPESTTTPVGVEKKQTTGPPVNINTFFRTQTYPSISFTGSTSTDRALELSSSFSENPNVTGGETTDTTIPPTSTLEQDTSSPDYTTSPQSSIRTQSLPIHLNSILGSTQKYDQTSPFKTVQTEITTTVRSRFGNRRIPILPAGSVQSTTNRISASTQTTSTTTPVSTTKITVTQVSPENNQQQLSNVTTTTSSTTTTTTTEQKPIQDFSVYGILPNNTVVRKRPPQVSRQLDVGIMVYGILPNQTVVRKYPNGTLMIVDSSKDVEVVDIDPKMLFNPFSELYRTSQSSLLLTTHRSTTSHRLIESNHILSSSSSSSSSTEVPNNYATGSGQRGNSIKETTESGNTDSALTTNTDDENLIQWLSENEDNILNSTILFESNTENAVLLDLLKRKYIKTDLPSRSSNVVSLTTVRNVIEENSIQANKEEDVSENTLFDSSEEKNKDSVDDLFLSKGSVVPNRNSNNDDENVISKQFDTSYANVGIGSIFAGNKGRKLDNSQRTKLYPINYEMAIPNTTTKLFPIHTFSSSTMHKANHALQKEFLAEVVNRTHGVVVENPIEVEGLETATPKRDGESKFIDFGILESEVDSEANGDYFMDPEDRLKIIDDGFDFDTGEGSGNSNDDDGEFKGFDKTGNYHTKTGLDEPKTDLVEIEISPILGKASVNSTDVNVSFSGEKADSDGFKVDSATSTILSDSENGNIESPFVHIVFPEGVLESSEKFSDIYTTVNPLRNTSLLFESEYLIPSSDKKGKPTKNSQTKNVGNTIFSQDLTTLNPNLDKVSGNKDYFLHDTTTLRPTTSDGKDDSLGIDFSNLPLDIKNVSRDFENSSKSYDKEFKNVTLSLLDDGNVGLRNESISDSYQNNLTPNGSQYETKSGGFFGSDSKISDDLDSTHSYAFDNSSKKNTNNIFASVKSSEEINSGTSLNSNNSSESEIMSSNSLNFSKVFEISDLNKIEPETKAPGVRTSDVEFSQDNSFFTSLNGTENISENHFQNKSSVSEASSTNLNDSLILQDTNTLFASNNNNNNINTSNILVLTSNESLNGMSAQENYSKILTSDVDFKSLEGNSHLNPEMISEIPEEHESSKDTNERIPMIESSDDENLKSQNIQAGTFAILNDSVINFDNKNLSSSLENASTYKKAIFMEGVTSFSKNESSNDVFSHGNYSDVLNSNFNSKTIEENNVLRQLNIEKDSKISTESDSFNESSANINFKSEIKPPFNLTTSKILTTASNDVSFSFGSPVFHPNTVTLDELVGMPKFQNNLTETLASIKSTMIESADADLNSLSLQGLQSTGNSSEIISSSTEFPAEVLVIGEELSPRDHTQNRSEGFSIIREDIDSQNITVFSKDNKSETTTGSFSELSNSTIDSEIYQMEKPLGDVFVKNISNQEQIFRTKSPASNELNSNIDFNLSYELNEGKEILDAFNENLSPSQKQQDISEMANESLSDLSEATVTFNENLSSINERNKSNNFTVEFKNDVPTDSSVGLSISENEPIRSTAKVETVHVSKLDELNATEFQTHFIKDLNLSGKPSSTETPIDLVKNSISTDGFQTFNENEDDSVMKNHTNNQTLEIGSFFSNKINTNGSILPEEFTSTESFTELIKSIEPVEDSSSKQVDSSVPNNRDSQKLGMQNSVADNSTKVFAFGFGIDELKPTRTTDIEALNVLKSDQTNDDKITQNANDVVDGKSSSTANSIELNKNIESTNTPSLSNGEEDSYNQVDSIRNSHTNNVHVNTFLTTSSPFEDTDLNDIRSTSTSDVTSDIELKVSEKLGDEFYLPTSDNQQNENKAEIDNETPEGSAGTLIRKNQIPSPDSAVVEESDQIGINNEATFNNSIVNDQFSASNTSDPSYITLSVEDFFQQFEEQEVLHPNPSINNNNPQNASLVKSKNNSSENIDIDEITEGRFLKNEKTSIPVINVRNETELLESPNLDSLKIPEVQVFVYNFNDEQTEKPFGVETFDPSNNSNISKFNSSSVSPKPLLIEQYNDYVPTVTTDEDIRMTSLHISSTETTISSSTTPEPNLRTSLESSNLKYSVAKSVQNSNSHVDALEVPPDLRPVILPKPVITVRNETELLESPNLDSLKIPEVQVFIYNFNDEHTEKPFPISDYTTQSGRVDEDFGAQMGREKVTNTSKFKGNFGELDSQIGANKTNGYHDLEFKYENVNYVSSTVPEFTIESERSEKRFPTSLNTNGNDSKVLFQELFNSTQPSSEDLVKNDHSNLETISQAGVLGSNNAQSYTYLSKTFANDSKSTQAESKSNYSEALGSKDETFQNVKFSENSDFKEEKLLEIQGFNSSLSNATNSVIISQKTEDLTGNVLKDLSQISNIPEDNTMTVEAPKLKTELIISLKKNSLNVVNISQNSENSNQTSFELSGKNEFLNDSQKEYPGTVQVEIIQTNKSEVSDQYNSSNAVNQSIEHNSVKSTNILERPAPSRDQVFENNLHTQENGLSLNDSKGKNKTSTQEVWTSSISSEILEKGSLSESQLTNKLSLENSPLYSKQNNLSVQNNGSEGFSPSSPLESEGSVSSIENKTNFYSSENEIGNVLNFNASISLKTENEVSNSKPQIFGNPLLFSKSNVSSSEGNSQTIPTFIKLQFESVFNIGQELTKTQDIFSNKTSEEPRTVSSKVSQPIFLDPIIKTLNISFGSGITDKEQETDQHVVPRKGAFLNSTEELRNALRDNSVPIDLLEIISSSTDSTLENVASNKNNEEILRSELLSAKDGSQNFLLPNMSRELSKEALYSYNQIKEDGVESSDTPNNSNISKLNSSSDSPKPLLIEQYNNYVPTVTTNEDIRITSLHISSTETSISSSTTTEPNLGTSLESSELKDSLPKSVQNEMNFFQNSNSHVATLEVLPELRPVTLPKPPIMSTIQNTFAPILFHLDEIFIPSNEKNGVSSSVEVGSEREVKYSTQIPILQSANQILEQQFETSSVRPAPSKADKDRVSKIILELLNKSEQHARNISDDTISNTNFMGENSPRNSHDSLVFEKSSLDLADRFDTKLNTVQNPSRTKSKEISDLLFPTKDGDFEQNSQNSSEVSKNDGSFKIGSQISGYKSESKDYEDIRTQQNLSSEQQSINTVKIPASSNLDEEHSESSTGTPKSALSSLTTRNIFVVSSIPSAYSAVTASYEEFSKPPAVFYPVNSPKSATPSSQSKAAIIMPTNIHAESSAEPGQVSMIFPKDFIPTLNMALPGSLNQKYTKESLHKPLLDLKPSNNKNLHQESLGKPNSNHLKSPQEREFNSPLKPPSYFKESSSTSDKTTTMTTLETKSFVETTTPTLAEDKLQEVPLFVPGGIPIELMSNTDTSISPTMSSKQTIHKTVKLTGNKFVPGGVPRDLLQSMRTLPKKNDIVSPIFTAYTPLGEIFGHLPSNNVLPVHVSPSTTLAPLKAIDNTFHKTYQFNLKMLKSTIEKVENDVKVLKETFIKSLNKSTNLIDPLEEKLYKLNSLSNSSKNIEDFSNKSNDFIGFKSESFTKHNIAPVEQLDLLQETLDPALDSRNVMNSPQILIENSKFNLQNMMKNSEFKPSNSNLVYKMSANALANAQTINSIMSESTDDSSVSKSDAHPKTNNDASKTVFNTNPGQNLYNTVPFSETPQQLPSSEMNVESWTKLTPSEVTYSPIRNIEAHNQTHTETQYTIQQQNMYQESSTISSLENSFVIDNFKNSINTIAEPKQVDRQTTPTIYLVTPAPKTTTTHIPTTPSSTTPSSTTSSSTTTSTTPSTTTTSSTTQSTTTSTTTPIATTTTSTTTTPIYIIPEVSTTTPKPTIVFKAPSTTFSTIVASQSPPQTNTALTGANSELEKNIKLLEQLLQLQASLKPKPSSSSTTTTTTTTTPTPSSTTTTTKATEEPIKAIAASSADDEQFINQLRQLLLSQQQGTKKSTTSTTTPTPTPTTTTTSTTTIRKPITISPQNLQDLLNSFSTPSFTSTTAKPIPNVNDIEFLNSLREIGKIQVTTSAPTTFANRIIELALKNRPTKPTSPVFISTTVPPFVPMPQIKFPQILPSNEVENHRQDQASLSADLSLLSNLLGRRITIADLPQITQQFGGNRAKPAPIPVPLPLPRTTTTTTTTTPRTTRRTTTSTERPMTRDEIAEIEKNLNLLSTLLGRPVSLNELPLIMQELRSGRKPKGTASSGATINFITPSPFKTTTTTFHPKLDVSFPSQTPISKEEVIELLKDPSLGSPEQLNIYGQSNDAILAAVLKQRGIGPVHNNLPINDLFTQEQTQRPLRPTRPRPPAPPPPPQRRPVIDGLAWLWRTWQETGAPGNRVSKNNRQPTASASTRLESPLLVGAFGGDTPTPTVNSNEGGEYADLQYPQNPSFGQGNGLLTAAFGVTRAVSQFLGAAFQGAAKSVQSAFSPQAIQQPSLISLSG